MATATNPSPLLKPTPATRETPYRPLLWLAAAAALGVAADYGLAIDHAENAIVWWWGLAGAALMLSSVARRRGRVIVGAVLMVAAAFGLGGAWQHWRWNYFLANDLGLFAREDPQPACVEVVLAGRVKISPPEGRSPLRAIPARTFSEATVEVVAIRDGARWLPAAGRSRLRVAGELHGAVPGDRLRVFAQLGRQPPPMNPGQYDWAAAERRARRLCELYCDEPACVAVTEASAVAPWLGWIHTLRTWCSQQLADAVGPRHAPLVLATLLGDQERLSEETRDAFLNTGAIHLLVISGAHVAMLAGVVWGATRLFGLPSRWQVATTLAAILLYAAIVGFEPSVTRATILAVALLGALELGRKASAGNLLGAAAIVVLAINPCELFNSGTQFSFLAVAALVLSGRWVMRPRPVDPLRRLIAETRPWPRRAAMRGTKWLGAMTLVSLAVGAAVAPLVAYHFHVVTPASAVLTPLASPLVGVAIVGGLATVVLAALAPPLAPLAGAVCGGALHMTERMVAAAQGVPGAFSYAASPGAWWLWGLYGAAGLMVAVPALRPSRVWVATLAMLWAAAGYASLGAGRPAKGELRCTFLSVGHGACVVLELPQRQTILYDAGSLGSPETTAQVIASFLWERGIDRIDAIVLSHADIDHYNAVPDLLERFPVGVVYVSPMMFDPLATMGNLTAPNYLRDVLAERNVPLSEIWMNDRLRTADPNVIITVLHPPREGVFGRDNANSLLLEVEFAGRRILLPGDLESPGLELVLSDPPHDCEVLLAPHHGSAQSDPPGFAAWSTPEWVVISGGRTDRTLGADATYQQAGAAVLHTAHDGAATFTISPDGIGVSAWRRSDGP